MSASDKSFTEGTTLTYNTPESGESINVNISDSGLFLINIMFRGNDNEHMSTYIFNQSSVYAKKINVIQTYNYNNNTSAIVAVNPQGSHGFYVEPVFTSAYSLKIQYRKLMSR